MTTSEQIEALRTLYTNDPDIGEIKQHDHLIIIYVTARLSKERIIELQAKYDAVMPKKAPNDWSRGPCIAMWPEDYSYVTALHDLGGQGRLSQDNGKGLIGLYYSVLESSY